MQSFTRLLFVLFVVIPFLVFSQSSETLNRSDVTKVMGQIFERHIDKKEMTTSILSHALGVYIEQFDPAGIYLLQGEVEPVLHPSESDLARVLSEYQKGDYSAFDRLDDLVQKGVERATKTRNELMKDPKQLFDDTLAQKEVSDPGNGPYPTNSQELQARIRLDLLGFISALKERYGEAAVLKRESYVFQMYKNDKEAWEEPYTYRDGHGNLLPDLEKEHLATLHILKALASSLDSHTSFLSDSEAYDMKTRLLKGYYGTGITFERGIEGVTVVKVIKDSPAYKSGQVSEGDILVKFDGKNIEEEPYREVMKAFEEKQGDKVTLDFRKPSGDLYSLSLNRELIMLDDARVSVDSIPFSGGIIGRLTLDSFYQGDNGVSSEQDLIKGIEELKKKGPIQALILDLRSNSGGYLSQAVKVAGLFITNGVVVISKYDDGSMNYYRDIDGKTYFNGPLIILVSRMTASAAEIVAQALQDYGVAVVVGDDRTFGKGSIQNQTVTSGDENSFFKVTVGKYYTVSGKTPQKVGVITDVVVPSDLIHENIGEVYVDGALGNDHIDPSFQDSLKDLNSATKGWYLRYYLPTLQPSETEWKKMIPDLQVRSEKRLKSEGVMKGGSVTALEQVQEAYRIAQDMVELRSKWDSPTAQTH